MELTKAGGVLGTVGGSPAGVAGGAGATAGGASFTDALKGALNQVVDAQKQSEAMTLAAASGDDVALHQVVQAISQAELTLQTLVTVRDKAVEAYQQIMQMPV